MKGLRIVSMGSSLPEKVVTNDDLSKIVDTSDEWISSRTGIKERRISTEGETNYQFALEAAKKAIERAGIGVDEIGTVIVATITPDYMFPSTACIVQKELGLPDDVMSFVFRPHVLDFCMELKWQKAFLKILIRNMHL